MFFVCFLFLYITLLVVYILLFCSTSMYIACFCLTCHFTRHIVLLLREVVASFAAFSRDSYVPFCFWGRFWYILHLLLRFDTLIFVVCAMISSCGLTSIAEVAQLTCLKELNVYSNSSLTSLQGVEKLETLEKLNARYVFHAAQRSQCVAVSFL